MLYLTASGHSDYTINWSGNATTGDNNFCRIADITEFQDYAVLFREYRIVGVKWQVYPNMQVNTGGTSTVTQGIATCH